MKRLFLFLELLFVIGAAVTLWLIQTSPAHKAVIPVFGNSEATVFSSGRLTQLLALGKQNDAERLVRHPQNLEEIFWKAVMVRSRFDDRGSMPLFIRVIRESTDSPEGLASACIVGVDLSRRVTPALYYFNALMILAGEHPDSVPIHWMAAVMSRTLTRQEMEPYRHYALPDELRQKVLLCGVEQYQKTLSLLKEGQGPVLIHQTLANLYDDLEEHEKALQERKIAVSMERKPWSLHAYAVTLKDLGRNQEALPIVQEAIAMEEKKINQFSGVTSSLLKLHGFLEWLKIKSPEFINFLSSLEALQKALSNPVELRRYYEVEGDILWNLGKTREALEIYDKAFQKDPGDQYQLNLCMETSRKLGDYDQAYRYSLRGMQNDPHSRYYKIWNARFGVLVGEPGAAAKLFQVGSFDFKGEVSKPEKKSNEPWFAAVEEGDLKKMQELIPSVDINKQDSEQYHQTALMDAAQVGWEPIVRDLLKNGAKTDLIDRNGDTALHYSIQFKQPRIARLIIEAGSPLNIKDKWNQTPLIMAVTARDWNTARLILDQNPDVNLASPIRGSALHCAAGFGELEIMNMLIAHGADVNLRKTGNGETPIMSAMEFHHAGVIQPLLDAGADINLRDFQDSTALHHAIAPRVDTVLIDYLLKHGASPVLQDKNEISPITKARLLGYDELAVAMENKAEHPEAFQFPPPDPNNPSATLEANNAALYILPIRMAMGYFPKPCGFPPTNKKEAAKDLKAEFGIATSRDLGKSIALLQDSQALHFEAGRLSLDPKYAWLQNLLTKAVWKIEEAPEKRIPDTAAWAYSSIILLARIGFSAGFISAEESNRTITDAAKVISGRFKSWNEFTESLIQGVRLHEEWEEPRYRNICRRILESGIPWPEIQQPPTSQDLIPVAATQPPTPQPTSSPSPIPMPEAGSAPIGQSPPQSTN